MPKGTRKGSPDISALRKAQISRRYQELGGPNKRGAASQTAREFNIKGSGASSKVKAIDSQVRDGKASSTRNRGRKCLYSEAIGQKIDAIFAEDDRRTYEEVGAELGVHKATAHRYATKHRDYKCITGKRKVRLEEVGHAAHDQGEELALPTAARRLSDLASLAQHAGKRPGAREMAAPA